MELGEARTCALAFLGLLAGGTMQAEIAGSIRRERPEVKDIEIVIEPLIRHLPNLFGDAGARVSLLDERIAELTAAGVLALDTRHRRNGPKYRRYVRPDADGPVYEVFLADEDNWGNILAIRTGDAAFSRALVTSRVFGGLMPAGLEQRDGRLWRGRAAIACRTEEEFFGALGIGPEEIPHPADRTEETARRLARKAVAR